MRRAGFTLVEVLIAIAMLIMLVGSMFAFYFNILASRGRALEFIRQQEAATALINWLDADLATCVAGDAVSGAGVKGDSQSVRLLTRGVASNLAQRGVDDPEVFGDLQLAEYRFDAAQSRIEGRRGPVSATMSSNARAEFAPLEGVVHHLRLRYFDGETWQDSFDSLSRNRLPSAVEVAIWLHPIAEEDSTLDELPTDFARESESPATAPASRPEVLEDDDELDLPPDELPPPDRVRVIVIPDAQLQDDAPRDSKEISAQ